MPAKRRNQSEPSGVLQFVPDDRYTNVPPLPADRPATRREVWEHHHHLRFDLKGHKETPLCKPGCNHRNPGELENFCRDAWVWDYVSRYNFKGWRKQPDWTEGQPVIEAAVPTTPFISGESATWIQTMKVSMDIARNPDQADLRRAA